LYKFCTVLRSKRLVCLLWCILRPFGVCIAMWYICYAIWCMYCHVVYFTAIWCMYCHVVYLLRHLVYCFPFWYVVPRRIWQPWSSGFQLPCRLSLYVRHVLVLPLVLLINLVAARNPIAFPSDTVWSRKTVLMPRRAVQLLLFPRRQNFFLCVGLKIESSAAVTWPSLDQVAENLKNFFPPSFRYA
jgi:hypothetical protein